MVNQIIVTTIRSPNSVQHSRCVQRS